MALTTQQTEQVARIIRNQNKLIPDVTRALEAIEALQRSVEAIELRLDDDSESWRGVQTDIGQIREQLDLLHGDVDAITA